MRKVCNGCNRTIHCHPEDLVTTCPHCWEEVYHYVTKEEHNWKLLASIVVGTLLGALVGIGVRSLI